MIYNAIRGYLVMKNVYVTHNAHSMILFNTGIAHITNLWNDYKDTFLQWVYNRHEGYILKNEKFIARNSNDLEILTWFIGESSCASNVAKTSVTKIINSYLIGSYFHIGVTLGPSQIDMSNCIVAENVNGFVSTGICKP